MATSKDISSSKNVTTRRGFIAACGAAVAATALPTVAAGPASWAGIRGSIPGLRAAYLAEVERFAESLRPRFESGELRAENEALDVYDYENPEAWSETCPKAKLDRLAAKHFGLEVARTTRVRRIGDYERENETFDGDTAAAYLILAVSPHGEAIGSESYHPAYDAQDCVAWDVIRLARSRGWYTPLETECEDPLDE